MLTLPHDYCSLWNPYGCNLCLMVESEGVEYHEDQLLNWLDYFCCQHFQQFNGREKGKTEALQIENIPAIK